MDHYFEHIDLISSCLSENDEVYVHSNWRGMPKIVDTIISNTSLAPFYKECLSLNYNNDSRLINVLHHLKDTKYKGDWIAIDDYDDLFYLTPEHFIKCDSRIGFNEVKRKELQGKTK